MLPSPAAQIDLITSIFGNDPQQSDYYSNKLASKAVTRFLLRRAKETLESTDFETISNISDPNEQLERLTKLIRANTPDFDDQVVSEATRLKQKIIITILTASGISSDQAEQTLLADNLKSTLTAAIGKLTTEKVKDILQNA